MSSAGAAVPAPPLLFRGLRGASSADAPREVLAGVTLDAFQQQAAAR
jgi:hypothetical protein